MRARDLAEPFPTVGLDDQALDAARLLAEHRLPGVLLGVITASNLLNRLLGDA
ncbi:hypothetical protein GCM10009759_58710 [Kitasatospora saccharophila]|uniref:Uncharacterized protein n=1 Tax=Kitasatospora saccharophila TaxID=407973 RepID=A0ABN2XMB4_9ACTN